MRVLINHLKYKTDYRENISINGLITAGEDKQA